MASGEVLGWCAWERVGAGRVAAARGRAGGRLRGVSVPDREALGCRGREGSVGGSAGIEVSPALVRFDRRSWADYGNKVWLWLFV